MRGRAGVRVGVITDSTACLPEAFVAEVQSAFLVVPLTVTIDGESHIEGEGVSGDSVSAAEKKDLALSTARPSPARMVEAYEDLAGRGCTHIVSVHAAATLSSTVNSARLAAAEASVPVTVIDSCTVGMALGFSALGGARAALRGLEADGVAQVVREVASSSRTALYVDSLQPLRRGGRVGRSGALFGSALSIRPLLRLEDGVVEPLARVRTTSKAIERLGTWTLEEARALGAGSVVCAVHALARPDLAERLTRVLEEPDRRESGDVAPWAEPVVQATLAPAVSAHVGSGAVGVAVARMPEPFGPDDASEATPPRPLGRARDA